jgi:transposase InsO family protein/transposase-like protein
MKLTLEDKLEMCKEHMIEKKSLSHIAEIHNYYNMDEIKYAVNLYKLYGEKPFINRENGVYRRDTKLLAISRIKNGESIRKVSLDLGLINYKILSDWVKKYNNEGEQSIQDTYPRKNYLNEDDRYKKIVDKKLKEENERLKAEIDFLKKSQSLAQKLEELTTKEKVKVVNELRTKYELKVLLEMARIPLSVYYYQCNSIRNAVNKYEDIEKEIDYLYLGKHKRRIGYQRIYIELKNQGKIIGKNKVLKIMREKGYTKKNKTNYRRYNSYKGDLGGVKPNILEQDFKATKPFEKAGTDVTMFRVKEEAVYLSPVIDFFTREVLSYEVGTDAKMDKVLGMLNNLKKNYKNNIKGMIIQSDQGVQYQNSRYSDALKELEIIQSMSRKGNCLDNSPTENFFGRLKEEMWYNNEYKYETAKDLIKEIHNYIKYYNETRIVTRLKTSPINYRNKFYNNNPIST